MMEQRSLGASPVSVSVVGLGTWAMSGAFWGAADDDESVRVVRRAVELGVTLIDTAEGYGDGHAEEVIGRALAGHRERAVIATKVAPRHLEPRELRQAHAASCERLGTDYLDIYFIHWPNPEVPIGPTMEELERLRAGGQIRALGASNFTAKDIELASQYGSIDVLQPPYNMFWREIEAETLAYCQAHQIGVIPYSGLAQGLLTGALRRDTTFAEDDRRPTTILFRPEYYERAIDAVERIAPVAAKYGKTMAQLAIQWLVSRPGITSGLCGARTVTELEENVEGVGWQIQDDDHAFIDATTQAVWKLVSEYQDMFGRFEVFGNPRLPDQSAS